MLGSGGTDPLGRSVGDAHTNCGKARRERLFTKSPLWADALKLETDAFLQPVTQH